MRFCRRVADMRSSRATPQIDAAGHLIVMPVNEFRGR
jgi:hypothetical protein